MTFLVPLHCFLELTDGWTLPIYYKYYNLGCMIIPAKLLFVITRATRHFFLTSIFLRIQILYPGESHQGGCSQLLQVLFPDKLKRRGMYSTLHKHYRGIFTPQFLLADNQAREPAAKYPVAALCDYRVK